MIMNLISRGDGYDFENIKVDGAMSCRDAPTTIANAICSRLAMQSTHLLFEA
jgi:tagatose-1,6-bisphosphate aldolase non-catalytic subunit AgaZ/GatZ